ncbi:hypothetical protein B0J18DRAFT_362900 [Chaetomium sp. MPI-SDFR-AT-0129]|nr:hypothetical protein B0J18DRAFT_362900 [Chaetomium sp. MPI-SDFR-AT-0129]
MSPNRITVHTSTLFEPIRKAFLDNVSIEVDTKAGAIVGLLFRDSPDIPLPLGDGEIDLRGKVVLPGFVDSHTHIFLHSDSDRYHSLQMRDESPVERIVRATNHARAALMAGFTTYRDLGTEALGAADANFRDCINRGLTAGPRMFVATEALASNGGYEIRTENRLALGSTLGLSLPRAADLVDGPFAARAGVRRRIGEGADVIKFYGDYRKRIMRFPPDVPGPGGTIQFPPDRRERNPAIPLFSQEEMDAIVAEAKLTDVPVAAHAVETRTALMAARAGVTTIEHIFVDTEGSREEMVEEMRKQKTIWVPTLATAEEGFDEKKFSQCKAAVKQAFDRGVKLAAGGDTGVFNHGLNSREMEIYMEMGIPVEDALVAGTYAGWLACGGDSSGFRFGWWDQGNRADIVALDDDPRRDPKALRKVSFVMKDGRVWKRDGQPVDMIPATSWPEPTTVAEKDVDSPKELSEEQNRRTKAAVAFVGTNPSVLSMRGSSGNPTPAASDGGWETESLDVKVR